MHGGKGNGFLFATLVRRQWDFEIKKYITVGESKTVFHKAKIIYHNGAAAIYRTILY